MPPSGDDRPRPLPLRLDGLPTFLLESPRAVLWKYILVNGTWTKVPFRVANAERPASSTDPSTWGAMRDAITDFEDGKSDGIGIVLGDGLIGIDLDHCRNPETGMIASWALAIVETLDSYAEASPSGTGVHIFATGTFSPTRKKKSGVEMYDR